MLTSTAGSPLRDSGRMPTTPCPSGSSTSTPS
jgi:hypothetical protein